MAYQKLTEEQRAAHQAIAEIVADQGVAFAFEALADAVQREAQTQRASNGNAGDDSSATLQRMVDILRQMAAVFEG